MIGSSLTIGPGVSGLKKKKVPTVPSAPGVAARTQPGTTPAPGAVKSTATPLNIPWASPFNVSSSAPPKPQGPVVNIPKFTPGALGVEAQQAMGDLITRLRLLTGLDENQQAIPGAIGSLQAERDRVLRDIAQNRLTVGTNRDQGLIQDDRGAAGRDMYLSGVRLEDRANTVGQAQRQFNNLTQAETDALAAYQRALDEATADFSRQKNYLTTADTQQQYQNWLQTQEVPPTVTAPETVAPATVVSQAPKKKIFTMAEWRAYHKAAGTKLPTDPKALRQRYDAYVAAHSK